MMYFKKIAYRADFISLFLILAVANILRLVNCFYGFPYLWNWDEPIIVHNAIRMIREETFNPGFFDYGAITVYISVLANYFNYYVFSNIQEIFPEILNSWDDVEAILPNKGWMWSTTHPSFYFVNRVFSSFFATGNVLMVYLISSLYTNRRVSHIGALILAVLAVHVHFSTFVSADMPMFFFFLALIWLLSLFHKKQSKILWYLSLVAVGLAISTKYNAVVLIIMPGVVLFSLREKIEFAKSKVRYFEGFLIPFLVFLASNPFFFIYWRESYNTCLDLIKLYYATEASSSVSPNVLEQLLVQIKYLNKMINAGVLSVSVLAMLFVCFQKKYFILTISLFLYVSLMLSTKPNNFRNYAIIIPFFCIFINILLFKIFKNKIFTRKVISILVLVVVSLSLESAYSVLNKKHYYLKEVDSRSFVVNYINMPPSSSEIVIASELRMHKMDIDRISRKYRILSLKEISRMSINSRVIMILPGGLRYDLKNKKRAEEISYLKTIKNQKKLFLIQKITGREIPSRGPIENPSLEIYFY